MSDTDESIRHEEQAGGGRFALEVDGAEAELTYRLRDDGALMDINHTFTPPAMRGQGVASRLMKRAVAHARLNAWKIRPTCPYAADWMERHPTDQDLLVK